MAPHPALVFAMVLSIYTGARCIPINLGVFLLAALSPAASGSKPDDVALVAAIMATVIGLCGAPLGHHKGILFYFV